MATRELPDSETVLQWLNAQRGPFNELLGLTFTAASKEELRAEVEVRQDHLQPYGIVHGGVLSSIVETMCSTGAGIVAFERGQATVGLENNTSFLRAVRQGKLQCVARPEHPGRTSQVWTTEIYDEEGKKVAVGRVRLLCFEEGSQVAGKAVEMPKAGS